MRTAPTGLSTAAAMSVREAAREGSRDAVPRAATSTSTTVANQTISERTSARVRGPGPPDASAAAIPREDDAVGTSAAA